MKRNYFKATLLVGLAGLFIMASCEKEMIGTEPGNTPVNNFELFWKTFDQRYGLFDVKQINWQGIHDQFSGRVNDQTTDEELYQVFSDMIVLLNDNHVNLYPTNGDLPVFPGGVLSYRNGELKILKVQEDYDLEVVKKYATDYQQLTPFIGCGQLPGNIGYLSFTGTDPRKKAQKAMNAALARLAGAKGLIVDIRGNYGGFDPTAQYVAGRFAAERKLYMTTRKRNGPAHDNFTSPVEWFVEPTGNAQYTKPIVLLTSRFTQSVGETFTLAMRQRDRMTMVGDTTSGCFSDNPNFELYNGWLFSLSVGDYRAADGQSYEGIGIAPDIFIRNTREDLLAGKDLTLEKAMEVLDR